MVTTVEQKDVLIDDQGNAQGSFSGAALATEASPAITAEYESRLDSYLKPAEQLLLQLQANASGDNGSSWAEVVGSPLQSGDTINQLRMTTDVDLQQNMPLLMKALAAFLKENFTQDGQPLSNYKLNAVLVTLATELFNRKWQAKPYVSGTIPVELQRAIANDLLNASIDPKTQTT